jgi:putative ABC transport system permease protein
MFLRVLKESFARAKGRQALAVIAIALGAAVATAMLGVYLSAGDRVNRDLRAFGANFTITPASDSLPVEIGGVDYRPASAGAFIAESDLPNLKKTFWANNIVAFAPYLYVPVPGSRYTLIGTWFDHEYGLRAQYHTGVKATNPTWQVAGEWPADEGEPHALAGRGTGLRIGDALPITPSIRVSGILTTGGTEDDQVFVPLAFAQKLSGQANLVRRVQVSVMTMPEDAFARRDPDTMSRDDRDRWVCSPYVSSVIYGMQEVLPGTVVRQVRQVAQNDEQVMTRISLLLLLVTGGALAASALAVSSATAAVVLERRTEIALMKAIGSTQWLVAAFFLAETAIQGLLGGGIGYLIGYFVSDLVGRQVFDAPSTPPSILLPIVLTLSVAVSWLGAAAPLRAAIRVAPAMMLKEAR